VYARHARGLTLKGLNFTLDAEELRPAIVLQDVEDAKITECQFPVNAQSESLVRLESVRGATITGAAEPAPRPNFLRVEGKDSTGIRLEAKGATEKSYKLAEGVDAAAVTQQ
jgi:hypothetical protein